MEACLILDVIDRSTPVGLRDRRFVALMLFSLVRVGAALGMLVEDEHVQQRRLWVRLRNKRGQTARMPCHYTPEEALHA